MASAFGVGSSCDAVEDAERQFLFDSIRQGATSDVRRFLATYTHFDINEKNKYGETPLYVAASLGEVEILSLLLESNADVNIPKQDGSTPLLAAADKGHEEIVDVLIAFGADVNNADNVFGMSALFLAAGKAHEGTVGLLISNAADLDFKDRGGSSVLHQACMGGSAAVVEALLAHGATLDVRDDEAYSPLHAACSCQFDNTDVVRLLISREDVDIDATNNDGDTALHLSAQLGCIERVETLLEFSASLTICNASGLTPLDAIMDFYHSADPRFDGEGPHHFAVRHGLVMLLRGVMEQFQIDINHPNTKGETCLHMAAAHPELDVASALIDVLLNSDDLDIDARSARGDTPLAFAALRSNVAAVDQLLEADADVDTVDAAGWSPLYFAVRNGNMAVVSLLLDKGQASVELPGQPCLLVKAVSMGSAELIGALLAAGADVNVIDENGSTALGAASREGNVGLVSLLLLRHADVNAGDPPPLVSAIDRPTAYSEEVVDLLMRQTATQSFVFDRALAAAGMRGHDRLVSGLLAKGARYNVPLDAVGNTALTLTKDRKCLDLLTRQKNFDELMTDDAKKTAAAPKPKKKPKKKKKKKPTPAATAATAGFRPTPRTNGFGKGGHHSASSTDSDDPDDLPAHCDDLPPFCEEDT